MPPARPRRERATASRPQSSTTTKHLADFAEYVRSTYAISQADTRSDITNQGWDMTGSYVVTGESASDRGVHPEHSFDPANREWGAFQIAARYSQLRVDPRPSPTSSRSRRRIRERRPPTIALNWYPNPFLKVLRHIRTDVADRRRFSSTRERNPGSRASGFLTWRPE